MDPVKHLSAFEPTKRAFSLLGEFKNFALKGNVIDLAVAVIIGAAFGKLVSSLVDNIFMPLLTSLIPGDKSYEAWSIAINGQELKFGKFLGELFNFLIVSFALFLFIQKFLGVVFRTKKEEVVSPPPLSKDQELLTEIRDLLKARG